MFCNLIGFCSDFLQWFRSNYFAYYTSLPSRSNISIRKTLERIRKSYSFSKNDSKHEINFGKDFALEGVEAAYIVRTIFLIYSCLKSCAWLLLVAATLPVTSASCEKKFSTIKFVKTFPTNSMTSERLGDTDQRSGERYELKNRFRWFRRRIWQSTWQSKD